MKIPQSLLDATASSAWRTAPTTPVRMARALPVDDGDAPEEPRISSAATAPTVRQPVPQPLPPGDLLHAALLSVAGDDAACAMLLAAATREAREGLSARLAYLEMSTLDGRNPPLAALVASLNAAADDATRTAVLGSASPALLVELAGHLHRPRCDDLADRYMLMVQ
jgi:hypothetical protein